MTLGSALPPSLVLALSLALSACGAAAAKPTVNDTTPQKRSSLEPEKKRPSQRQLVAPPPAYGNKVVLAPSARPEHG